jgi:hypothetical protein
MRTMKTVTHPYCADTEVFALTEKLGIDPDAIVHPRTELSFAIARRRCGKCTSKERCQQASCGPIVTLNEVATFCPSADLLVELLCRQPMATSRRRSKGD